MGQRSVHLLCGAKGHPVSPSPSELQTQTQAGNDCLIVPCTALLPSSPMPYAFHQTYSPSIEVLPRKEPSDRKPALRHLSSFCIFLKHILIVILLSIVLNGTMQHHTMFPRRGKVTGSFPGLRHLCRFASGDAFAALTICASVSGLGSPPLPELPPPSLVYQARPTKLGQGCTAYGGFGWEISSQETPHHPHHGKRA